MSQSRERLKSLFTEFVETTTLHGIRYVFCGDSKLRRSIWFLFFLFSTGMFIWNIGSLFKSYLNTDVVTRASVVYQDKIMFPSVTFCNFNQITNSYVNKLSQESSDNDTQWLIRYFREEITADNDNFLPNFTYKVLIDASHKLENMLLNCTLRGEKCLPSDFDLVLTNMGVCYTFNAGEFIKKKVSIIWTNWTNWDEIYEIRFRHLRKSMFISRSI